MALKLPGSSGQILSGADPLYVDPYCVLNKDSPPLCSESSPLPLDTPSPVCQLLVTDCTARAALVHYLLRIKVVIV